MSEDFTDTELHGIKSRADKMASFDKANPLFIRAYEHLSDAANYLRLLNLRHVSKE